MIQAMTSAFVAERGDAADNSRDFLKWLFNGLLPPKYSGTSFASLLEVQYIGGYSVECSFKALILEESAPVDRPAI